ncbi:MAG: O-antigen ligase family protein [Chitinophagaceae bacterium]
MTGVKKNISISMVAWAKEVFFTQRMNSVPGWIVMALVGIGLAYAGVNIDQKIPLIVVGAAAGILFVLACLYYPELSYYSFIYSIIIFTLPARMFGIGLPLGVLIPGTGYLCVLSIMASQYRNRTSSASFWKTPISLMMLLLFFYLMLEAFNPEIDSRAGWWNLFQKQILYLLFYYASFLMFDSLEKIRRFVKYWIILATIVALWGVKQQYFGFTVHEDAWIHSDPNTTNLLFQGGMFRKFSLLPDPAAFGVMCTSSALFTLVLAIRTPLKKARKWLYVITFLQIIASSYSGTRTCNVMLIAGLLSYIIFTINERRTIIVLLSAIGMALFLLFGPLRNSPVIFRIKTTFEGSKEPSNMVRDVNRKNIQPYIYERPLGGGLQTCGEEGLKFYPTHRLAGYPPDSGYMKIMLEQGWIGLAINIIFYFIILQRGITGFYDSRKSEIKTLYIAFTVCFFSLVVGQYSQLGISQYPQYLFYLATLVIFYKLKEYDTKKPEDDAQRLA